MPTYSYRCNKCDEIISVFQSMKEEPLKDCDCGAKNSLSRIISGGSGLIFKGSGFYLTDYTDYGNNPDTKGKKKSDDKIISKDKVVNEKKADLNKGKVDDKV